MGEFIDELARAMASGLPRRELLKRLGGGALGGALLWLVPRGAAAAPGDRSHGNSDCAHFCNEVFPPGAERGHCKSEAAHGSGPCFKCGPAAPAGHPELCGQACCPAATPNCCGVGNCRNLAGDVQNCGKCGNACTAPANATPTCAGGTCGFACNPGFKPCNGACIPTANCCTNADCPGGQTCVANVCCRAAGQPAGAAGDCCAGLGTVRVGTSDFCCKPSGQACTTGPECCSGTCAGTTCA